MNDHNDRRDPCRAMLIFRALLVLLLGVLGTAEEALGAGQNARVTFLRGEVFALDEPSGVRRALARDSHVEAGEIIETGPKALAQLVFPDRSMLYVKADSRVKIERFRFEPRAPQQGSEVTEILKGGMRSITGLIGKGEPDAVQYKAHNTTIGIRGTAIEVRQVSDGVWIVTFDFGHGSATNSGGASLVGTGESLTFKSPTTAPKPIQILRPPNDPTVLARRLVVADRSSTASIAKEVGERAPLEDAMFVVGVVDQVPGYALGALTGTVEGFSSTFTKDQIRPLLTASAMLYPDDTPEILGAAVKGGVRVGLALEALMRGTEGPDPRVLERMLRRAVELGLSREEAERILKALQDRGICT